MNNLTGCGNKGQDGGSDCRETSATWDEDSPSVPQDAQQVQFTAEAGNFLTPHLSFKRAPRFSSTVLPSVFFKLLCMTPGKVKQPHLSVESEREDGCFSAEVTVRKCEGEAPKLS